jgi:hypothetical protein
VGLASSGRISGVTNCAYQNVRRWQTADESNQTNRAATDCPPKRGQFGSHLRLVLLLEFLGSSANLRAQPAPTSPPYVKPAAAPALRAAPWTGDFVGMLQRRFIRALVGYSKTQYRVRVMQLMPATGARVGDRDKQANIHGA